MKSPFLILLFTGISTVTVAQVSTDSLEQKLTSVSESVSIDSLEQKLASVSESVNIDSLEQKLPQLPDSLLPSYQKVDSIRSEFNQSADSIKTAYQSAVAGIDAQSGKVNTTIDSLQNLNLPTGKYTQKRDSLNQLRQNTTEKFTSGLDALKAKTTAKLNALDLPPQYKEPLQELTKNVDALNLPGDQVKIPSLEIPGYSLPEIEGVGDIASKAGEIGKISDLGNLPTIETPVGDLGQVAEQAKGYQDDIKSITQGNLDDVKQLPKTIEEQAGKLEGVQELQEQSGVIDEYKGQLDALKDPAKAKEQAVEKAKEVAIDHFAGKQEQLKAAMEKMSKYKQKYSSVSSLKDLPKRAPNAMRGKPIIERIVPGLFFQYQQKNHNLFDVNPYVGYRISGRFTSGIGWNYRYAYDRRKHEWNKRSRIYGPRAYVDFKLGKGFIAHLETEVMNTFVPATIRFTTDHGQREWVWGMMTGLKKEYKIYKSLRGTVLLQYNLFNPQYKAPYVDRLNSRIGFEYALKKGKPRNPKNK